MTRRITVDDSSGGPDGMMMTAECFRDGFGTRDHSIH